MFDRIRPHIWSIAIGAGIGIALGIPAVVWIESAQPSPEARYVQAVHENIPTFSKSTMKGLRDLGEKECKVLDLSGWDPAAKIVQNVGLTGRQAAFYLVETINQYCPSLHSAIPQPEQHQA